MIENKNNFSWKKDKNASIEFTVSILPKFQSINTKEVPIIINGSEF